ncbi:MAG: hypothetical protein ACO34E_17450 [Limisphaerales bacterium]|jgi:hypothetical protein
MRTILLATIACLLLTTSCASKPSGNREFIPGKGWVPVSQNQPTTQTATT